MRNRSTGDVVHFWRQFEVLSTGWHTGLHTKNVPTQLIKIVFLM